MFDRGLIEESGVMEDYARLGCWREGNVRVCVEWGSGENVVVGCVGDVGYLPDGWNHCGCVNIWIDCVL